ncbi:MAG: Gfo/Idh/MocA family oxidoreductase [Tannerella sp.]|jgi:predicted dehydrogenase|nr:Gfo/Idh/MocA family oxidoreductase [Tannerella sp.]
MKKDNISRREFLTTSAAAVGALTVVPSHVISASVGAARKNGLVAPSDRITLLHIGCGTEGHHEIYGLLKAPAIEIVGVADPNRESYDYRDWSPNGLANNIRKLIGEPDWKPDIKGIPGGRMIMKEVVEKYYRLNRKNYKGSVAEAEDFRELLDTLKDVDAVKIMSPDHQHAFQALECMRRGKHVIMHKPLGNKMTEAMKVVDVARASTKLSTHMMAYNAFGDGKEMNQIKRWIDAGAIGKLKEIHNWTNRPVWPQYSEIPKDKQAIPDGFNWDLWLGPAQMRDYHNAYTYMTFRGWYEFGAGSIADMGYYSLWSVFDAMKLDSAVSCSSRFSRVIGFNPNNTPRTIVNDYSYPMASAFRFEVPYKDKSGSVILQWHDGGMKPPAPEGYENDDLPIEGMMFIGTEGAIVSGFLREKPVIVGARAKQFAHITGEATIPNTYDVMPDGTDRWLQNWIDGVRGKSKNLGSFEFAKEVNETFNLGSVSLMCNGKKLLYDPATRTITNDAAANKLLTRDVRKGWEM